MHTNTYACYPTRTAIETETGLLFCTEQQNRRKHLAMPRYLAGSAVVWKRGPPNSIQHLRPLFAVRRRQGFNCNVVITHNDKELYVLARLRSCWGLLLIFRGRLREPLEDRVCNLRDAVLPVITEQRN